MPTLPDSATLFYHAVKQDEPHYAVDVDKQQGEQQSKYNQGADRRGEQQWIRGCHAGCGDMVRPAPMRPGKRVTASPAGAELPGQQSHQRQPGPLTQAKRLQ